LQVRGIEQQACQARLSSILDGVIAVTDYAGRYVTCFALFRVGVLASGFRRVPENGDF